MVYGAMAATTSWCLTDGNLACSRRMKIGDGEGRSRGWLFRVRPEMAHGLYGGGRNRYGEANLGGGGPCFESW